MYTPFYFLTDSYKSFRDVMVNMSLNAPELCEILMVRSLNSLNVEMPDYVMSQVATVPEVSQHDYGYSHYDEGYSRGRPLQQDENEKISKGVQKFLDWCTECHINGTLESDVSIDRFLRELYGRRAGAAIEFLLERADEETKNEFAASYLGSDYMAQNASVDIVVRENKGIWPRWGNKGRYVIYTRKGKDGEETLLKFTNQPSAVYYLLFLIDYKRKNSMPRGMLHGLKPIMLHFNERAFCEIYNKVYGIKLNEAYQRYLKLLYREDKYGNMRVGRQGEICRDIRRTLAKAFDAYDESYVPYVMSSRSHLSVPASHIIFEGDAAKLLDISIL